MSPDPAGHETKLPFDGHTSLQTHNTGAMMIWAHRLNTVHFKGLSIRSVSCYTLLREFLLPWPSSDCLNV